MKRFLTLVIAAATTFVAVPEVEARPHRGGHAYVSGHARCGCPVYRQRYVVRYDRWGHPVYAHRVLPVRHRCHRGYHRGHVIRIDAGPRHAPPRFVSDGVNYRGPLHVGGGGARRKCR